MGCKALRLLVVSVLRHYVLSMLASALHVDLAVVVDC